MSYALYQRAQEAARRNFGIPHTVWKVTYDNGHETHVLRERNQGPPCTGTVEHVVTTDGEITVQGGEFPREWPPKTQPPGSTMTRPLEGGGNINGHPFMVCSCGETVFLKFIKNTCARCGRDWHLPPSPGQVKLTLKHPEDFMADVRKKIQKATSRAIADDVRKKIQKDVDKLRRAQYPSP